PRQLSVIVGSSFLPAGADWGALETMIMVELRRTPRLVGRLRPGKTIHIGPSPIEPFAGPKNASAPKCRNGYIWKDVYCSPLPPCRAQGVRLAAPSCLCGLNNWPAILRSFTTAVVCV